VSTASDARLDSFVRRRQYDDEPVPGPGKKGRAKRGDGERDDRTHLLTNSQRVLNDPTRAP